jgi:4-phosphopantoate--beta-alanine ligase
MSEHTQVEDKHPRAQSIRIRERMTNNVDNKVVALAGLIAHGRGEAFDYILGEQTTESGMKAITAAAATLLLAKYPVLSVNGNAVALCPKELVDLSKASGAKLEVNLFHRLPGREAAIEKVLHDYGAEEVLGVGDAASVHINEVFSERRFVDPEGIYKADVVFVPLEDGDRTQGLVKMRKKVITVDLNPMSRTAQFATITIVDNFVRVMPLLISEVNRLKKLSRDELQNIVSQFSNRQALGDAMKTMKERLEKLAEKGVYIEPTE